MMASEFAAQADQPVCLSWELSLDHLYTSAPLRKYKASYSLPPTSQPLAPQLQLHVLTVENPLSVTSSAVLSLLET
jgi:hypothetical protein